jgi:outer membrane protein assembly factor BamD
MRLWRHWFTALLFLGVATASRADFTYSSATGWQSTDKSLETRLSQGLENPEALRLMNQAAAIYAAGDHEKARLTYRDVLSHYPTSLLAPEALYQIAKIRLEQKKIDKAYTAFGEIVSGYPSYPKFDSLLKEMFELAERLSDEKTQSFLGIWNYRDRDAAIEAFEKIVTAAPYSDYAPRALFLIARLYKEKNEPLSAIDAYERLIGSYPSHPLTPDAYLALAMTYQGMIAGAPYDQGATQKAIQYYQDFIAQYPGDPRLSEAQGKLQKMQEMLAQGKYDMAVFYYDKRHNVNAASNLLKEVIQIAPTSPIADKAQKLLEKISKEPATPKKSGSFLDSLIFWKK